MADDKTNRGPQDASRINIHEDYEVAYWTKKFGVSKAELEAAVGKVGVSADAVAKELGKTRVISLRPGGCPALQIDSEAIARLLEAKAPIKTIGVPDLDIAHGLDHPDLALAELGQRRVVECLAHPLSAFLFRNRDHRDPCEGAMIEGRHEMPREATDGAAAIRDDDGFLACPGGRNAPL
jgi:hypothetical protein